MGQNSSVAVGTSKAAPVKGDLIVDASGSCVSGVKLRSTGILPISELIKQEKCSKNIQKIEKNYYNRKKTVNKSNAISKPKKIKADFIDTSFEDVPAKRQWVRMKPEPESKHPFECDALKIGLKKPFNVGVQNVYRARSGERSRANGQNATRESVDLPEVARQSSTQKKIGKHVRIGTEEFNNDISPKSIRKMEEKKFVVDQRAKKSNFKNSAIEQTYKESSTQTLKRDKATSCENLKQLFKRSEIDERKRNRHNYVDEKGFGENKKEHKQNKKKALRDIEESTHQFQTHEISHPKGKSRKFGDKLKIETNMLCSIRPGKQFQQPANSEERRTGRNYMNRKFAGEYFRKDQKYNDDEINSCPSNKSSVSLLPSASTLEHTIKEHRKYVSAKEALESWKNLHTWKQHNKHLEGPRNKCHQHQDNFDAATQTIFIRPKSKTRNMFKKNYQQTYYHNDNDDDDDDDDDDDMIVPSEKHLYKDFILKMEHCLQKHSRLCEINAKRNGEAKYTWVQDKYRRWHKITFDDYKS